MTRRGAVVLVALAASGCDVSPKAVPSVCLAPPPASPAGSRGLVVVDEDNNYSSTNVRLVGWDATTYSESLVSSALGSIGLSGSFMGDVVVPSQPSTLRGEIVLLDQKTDVITWASPLTCGVRTQLPISPGFHGDPYDYLETSPDHAYVLRYDNSFTADSTGAFPGGDVLIIDPQAGTVGDSISLSAYVGPNQLPSPAQLLPWAAPSGGPTFALVVLENFTRGTSDGSAEDGVIVAIDETNDTVAFAVQLSGVQNCGAMIALSGGRVVVSCTGTYVDTSDMPTGETDIGRSALVVLSPTADGQLAESSRVQATTIGPSSFAPYLASPAGDLVLVGTSGNDVDATHPQAVPDTWLLVDVVQKTLVQTVAQGTAEGELGPAFVFGSVACDAGATPPVCFGADASGAGALRRFVLTQDHMLTEQGSRKGGDPYGLQPRYLGLW